MKKLILPWVTLCGVLAAMITGCNSPSSKNADIPSDSTAKDERNVAQEKNSPKSELNLTTVKFPLECANEEIQNFLSDAVLQGWAKDLALGGTFNLKEEFFSTPDGPADGVMMWFNLDNIRVDGKQTIVLAIEPGSKVGGVSPEQPRAKQLKYPDDVFTYDVTKPFRLEQHAPLIRHKLKEKETPLASINTRRASFIDIVNANANPRYGQPFNEHNGAFFQNNKDSADPFDTRGLLSRLLAQPGAVGVRYYLALKDDIEYDDMIRIILVATDFNGNDIIYLKDPKDPKKKVDALILQKSIPPGSQKILTRCP
jgi:hypothetical protein